LTNKKAHKLNGVYGPLGPTFVNIPFKLSSRLITCHQQAV